MKFFTHLALLTSAVVIFLSSCSTPKNVVYFQDTDAGSVKQIGPQEQIKLREGDRLSIFVSSKDPELAALFNRMQVTRNMNTVSSRSSKSIGSSGYGGNSTLPYTVNDAGCVDFPVIGEIQVAGMTRQQLENYIQSELRSRNLVKDALVTVEFYNLTVTVLGEVGSPGVYSISRDDQTILDVISAAGDLTIDGLRENVKVYRKTGNEEKTYMLDLTSATNVFSSPAYYMQQGDIIYVEPNDKAINASTNNGNTIRTYAFWMSLTSFLLSIGLLIIK